MEGRRLVTRRRRGAEGLGVFGEVLGTVGRVEALWENNERGARLCRLQDLGAGVGEVGGLVGA